MKSKYTSTEKKFLKQIGDNIKQLRTAQNVSQEDLAFKANLDRSYIGSVERGERNISLINFKKIADALKIDLTKLLNGKDK
jgi:transcriptional regulator with XRE-family HTH domain